MQPHLQPQGHDHAPERQGVGGAAHVLLHQPHARGRLDVEAAGVEHDALADHGDHGRGGLAPHDLDHARGPVRDGGAAHRVDGRIVLALGQQVVADHHLDLGAELMGDLAGDGLDLQRAHVVGRGVDHVARQGAGVDDRAGLIHPRGRRHEAGGALLGGLVTVVAVGAEAPGDGDVGGIEALGHRFQAVVAGRQAPCGRAEDLGLGLRAQAQQHAGGLAVFARQLQRLAGLGLEALGFRQSRRLAAERLQRRGEVGLGHGLERDGGFAGVEQGVGHGNDLASAARR